MPIIKSAMKKMRQDKTRTARNKTKRDGIYGLVKGMRRTPTSKALAEVSSVLDKAVKTKFIHRNKASRLKSRLSKLMATSAK